MSPYTQSDAPPADKMKANTIITQTSSKKIVTSIDDKMMPANGHAGLKYAVTQHACEVADTNNVRDHIGEKFSSTENLNKKVKEPPAQRDIEHSTSESTTLIHLLKGNIGPGILNMPEAFLHAGLYVGLIGVPIIGGICLHCMQLLLESSKMLCERTKRTSLSYEDTAEVAFSSSPTRLRHYSRFVRLVMMTFLVITQLGFCCVFFVFVSQNLYQAIECMTGGTGNTPLGYMAMIILPILLLCYISELKYMAPISFLASLLQSIGFVITFYYLVRDLSSGVVRALPASAGWEKLPLYFSCSIYAFEGIGLILPLENQMKRPARFGGACGILNTGMIVVIVMFAAVGFFGYLQYGADVAGSITLNLPPGETLAQSVKLLMALAIFLTYPIQFYVPVSILQPPLMACMQHSSARARAAARCAFKTALVLLTFCLAAVIPNIGIFISLVGAVSSSTLAIIFPPIVHLVTVWPNTGRGGYILIKAVLIVLFGLLGFVTGTYASIISIVAFLSDTHPPVELICH